MNILQVTSCRPKLFWRMLASLEAQPQLDDWQLFVRANSWPAEDLRRLAHKARVGLCTEGIKDGSLYQNRIHELGHMQPGDVLCFADDDMTFTEHTNYARPAALIRRDESVGGVACDYRQIESDTMRPLADIYTATSWVGIGGGLLIGYSTAQLIRNFGATPDGFDYRPDDIHFGCAAYVAGKMNYYYRGSSCLHNWGTAGGMLDVFHVNQWGDAWHHDYFERDGNKRQQKVKQFVLRFTERAHAEHAANTHRWLSPDAPPTPVDQGAVPDATGST